MRILTISLALLLALSFVACDEPADDEAADEPAEAEAALDDDSEAEADDQDDDGDHYGEDEDHEMADDLEPGDSGHYGADFSDDEDPIELAAALKKLEEKGEKIDQIKVEASIKHVCEKRGCWLALDTDAVDFPVRVHMKDYAFFVPRNGAGAAAVVEGSLAATTITEEEARHYAEHVTEQTGEDPEDIEGEQDMYEFTARAISMSLPED